MLLSLACLNLPSGHGSYTSAPPRNTLDIPLAQPSPHPWLPSLLRLRPTYKGFTLPSGSTLKFPSCVKSIRGQAPGVRNQLAGEEMECASAPPRGKWGGGGGERLLA